VSYFTAFVTRGPALPRRIGEEILATLDRRGLGSVRELRAAA
jgi:dihydroorotate dehydrogenase